MEKTVLSCTDYQHKIYLMRNKEPHCGKKFKWLLKTQKQQTFDFKCNECGNRFKNKYDISRHMQTHEDEQPFPCNECCKLFASKGELSSQLKIQVGKRPFKCTICEKEYKRKVDLARHMWTHMSEKSALCTGCKERYRRMGSLSPDRQTESNDQPKSAEQCYPEKNSKGNLPQNKVWKKLYSCSFCNRTFARKNTLMKHMITHSDKKLPYQCSICNRKFKTGNGFKLHVRAHTNDHPLQDLKHYQSLSSKYSLKGRKSGKPYRCLHCLKRFWKQSDLTKHMMLHGNKRKYVCKPCKKWFKSEQQLRKHNDAHADDPQFTCNVCDMRFLTEELLALHVKIHFEENESDSCSRIDKQFSSKRESFKKACFSIHEYLHYEDDKDETGEFKEYKLENWERDCEIEDYEEEEVDEADHCQLDHLSNLNFSNNSNSNNNLYDADNNNNNDDNNNNGNNNNNNNEQVFEEESSGIAPRDNVPLAFFEDEIYRRNDLETSQQILPPDSTSCSCSNCGEDFENSSSFLQHHCTKVAQDFSSGMGNPQCVETDKNYLEEKEHAELPDKMEDDVSEDKFFRGPKKKWLIDFNYQRVTTSSSDTSSSSRRKKRRCKFCNKKFKYFSKYAAHIQKVHGT